MLVTEQFDIFNVAKLLVFILLEHTFTPVLLCSSKLWNQFQNCRLVNFIGISLWILVPEGMAMVVEPVLFLVLCFIEVKIMSPIDPAK